MADTVTKNVNVIISAVDQYSGKMGMFAGSFSTIAIAAVAAEAAILAASIAAAKFAVSIGKEVFKSASEFHDAIFDVQAVAQTFGTTGEDIEGILDKLVKKFPITGKQGGEALQLIAQMGKGTKEELDKVADAALTLQIATGVDLETGLRGTLAALNAFGLGVEDVERVTNLFASVSFRSGASVTDLAEAMKYAAPVAKVTGISLEETAVALGMFRDFGLEASQAGTVFRRSIIQLLKETDRGRESLAKYGLTYADVDPSVQTLTELIDKFGGQTIEAKDAVNVFGARGIVMTQILEKGSEAFREQLAANTANQASVEAAAVKMQKWGVVVSQVEGSMDGFKNTIGKELVPALTEFVGTDENSGIRAVITKLQELEDLSGELGGPFTEAFEQFKKSAQDVFKDSFGDAEGFYKWLVQIAEALSINLQGVIIWGAEFSKMFLSSTSNVDTLKAALKLVNLAFTLLAGAVATFHDSFVIFTTIWGVAIDTVQWIFNGFVAVVLDGAQWIAKGLDLIPFTNFTEEIKGLEIAADRFKKKSNEAFDTKMPNLWIDNVARAGADFIHTIDKMDVKTKEFNTNVGEIGTNISNEDLFGVEGASDYEKAIHDINVELGLVKGEVKDAAEETGAWVKISEEGAQEIVALYAESGKTITLEQARNMAVLRDTTEDVTEIIKTTDAELSKLGEHKLNLETKEFESDLRMAEEAMKQAGDIAKLNLEWNAKLNIAQVEAGTKRLEIDANRIIGVMGEVNQAIVNVGESTSSTIDSLATAFESDLGFSDKWQLESYADQQFKMQTKLVDSQIKLAKAEENRLNAQTERTQIENQKIKDGEALSEINVSIEGDTGGWLDGLISTLFEELMVKAQAEAFSCLCESSPTA